MVTAAAVTDETGYASHDLILKVGEAGHGHFEGIRDLEWIDKHSSVLLAKLNRHEAPGEIRRLFDFCELAGVHIATVYCSRYISDSHKSLGMTRKYKSSITVIGYKVSAIRGVGGIFIDDTLHRNAGKALEFILKDIG